MLRSNRKVRAWALAALLLFAFSGGIVHAQEQQGAPAPRRDLCPESLRSSDPHFDSMRRTCDFNRKRLPPCPSGLPSLSERRGINGELRLQPARRTCTKEWTVIAFLAMDNHDLSEFGEDDLGEMFWGKAKDLDHSFDLVVEADFFATMDKPRSGKRYVIEALGDGFRSRDSIFRDYRDNEQNTGDPRTLEKFLEWAVEEFPSRNYFFIMGGHGDGWAATNPRELRHRAENAALAAGNSGNGRIGNGIALDENTGTTGEKDWLTVPDLRRIFARVQNVYLGGDPIDVYAADACFMQQAEVAFELRDHARFLYGSVPVMAFEGLPYEEILSRFARGLYDSSSGVDGARVLALDLPPVMLNSYRDKNDRVYASSIDTSLLESDFAPALSALGQAASEWLRHGRGEKIERQFLVSGAARGAVAYQSAVIELRSFLQEWEKQLDIPPLPQMSGEPALPPTAAQSQAEANLRSKIISLNQALERLVIAKAWGARYQVWESRLGGLSIWMPGTGAHWLSFGAQATRSQLHRYFPAELVNEEFRGGRSPWSVFLETLHQPESPTPTR